MAGGNEEMADLLVGLAEGALEEGPPEDSVGKPSYGFSPIKFQTRCRRQAGEGIDRGEARPVTLEWCGDPPPFHLEARNGFSNILQRVRGAVPIPDH